ncbi:MAG: elongation factor Ts [Bacilli bacterium]|nr:elongation factor Ts [Bacilli bacterium]MBR0194175.1 elongation factor Ts [Bacilli bacterium]
MIELIKELRDRTGAGMMDCKHALEESGQDVEKAIDWLRQKGIAKAQAKASRIAAEGLAEVQVNGNKAIICEINCETDFVSKGEKFHALVSESAKVTLEKGCTSLEEAKEATKSLFTDATVSMGEKLDYRRFEIVEKKAGEGFGSYIHMGGKIATLVVLDKEDPEFAKGLAMHIAANAPKYVAEEDIPADVIAHEKQIALENMKEDPKMAGKPAQMLEGIANGKVKKILSESVLGSQAYLLDGEKSVAQVAKEKGIKIVKFIRYSVGEGIEKRKDNFAEEVMKEIK